MLLSFQNWVFSELPQFGRKLIQCSFIYCACWIRRLNGRQSFLLQSEILRISSIFFFFFFLFFKWKRCIPAIVEYNRERTASWVIHLENEKKDVQKMSRSIISSGCLEWPASLSVPVSPNVTDHNEVPYGGCGCHPSIGLLFCCLMPKAFSHENVWLSSWKTVKHLS